MTPRLAVQLYSLRAEAAADFTGVLRSMAEIGFAGVETAGLNGMAPGAFRRLVDDLGLTVPSAHGSLPHAGDMAGLDEAEAIGAPILVASCAPGDVADADAVARTAERWNTAAALAAERGLAVGCHNHWWEFEPLPDGRIPYDLLLDALDPAVLVEIDLYWVRVGGGDPTAVVRTAGDRARLLHVKDGPVDPPRPMTACGAGAMDLASPIAAATAATWHVVELDECATDMTEAVRASHDHLVGAGLSAGR